MRKFVFILSVSMILVSCKTDTKKQNQLIEKQPDTHPAVSDSVSSEASKQVYFMDYTVNDSLAKRIANWLKYEHLKNDYEFLTDNDKKFQLAEIDLNGDGENEVFINFFSSYFCGTGGCSILLLNNSLKPITNFSVMRTPLYIQKETINNWNTILVKSGGKFRKLIYENGHYPSNPSIVEALDYEPSGHDLLLFDDDFSPSKTYRY
jgi:hypothetical protein